MAERPLAMWGMILFVTSVFTSTYCVCFAQGIPVWTASHFAQFDKTPLYGFVYKDYLIVCLEGPTTAAEELLRDELNRKLASFSAETQKEFENLAKNLVYTPSILIMKFSPSIYANWVIEREVPLATIVLRDYPPLKQRTQAMLFGTAEAPLQIRAIAPHPSVKEKKILILTNKGLVALNLENGSISAALLKFGDRSFPILSNFYSSTQDQNTSYQNKHFLHLATGDLDDDRVAEIVLIYGNINPNDVYKTTENPEIYVEALKFKEGDTFERIYLWRGSTIVEPRELGYLPSFVTLGDIDGNGDEDIVIVNSGEIKAVMPTGEVKAFVDVTVHVILSRMGTKRSFDQPRILSLVSVDQRPRTAIVHDFDGDGIKDIVIAGRSKLVRVSGADVLAIEPGRVHIIQGTIIDDDFKNSDPINSAVLQAVDLNMDGKLDIVAFIPQTKEVVLYKSGTERVSLINTELSFLICCDIDGNAFLDVLMAGTVKSLKALFSTRSDAVDRLAAVSDIALIGQTSYYVTAQGLKTGAAPEIKATVFVVQPPLNFETRPVCDIQEQKTEEEGITYRVEARLSTWQVQYCVPTKWEVLVLQAPAFSGTTKEGEEQADGSLIVFDKRKGTLGVPKVIGDPGLFPIALTVTNFYVRDTSRDCDALLILLSNGSVVGKALPTNLRWRPGFTPSSPTIGVPFGLQGKIRWFGAVDLDKESWDELVFVAQKESEAIVAVSTRASLESSQYRLPAIDIVNAALADLDSDGFFDLVLLDRSLGELFVLWGKERAQFEPRPSNVSGVGKRPTGLAISPFGVIAVVDPVGSKVTIIRVQGRELKILYELEMPDTPLAIAAASSALEWLAPRSKSSGEPCSDFMVSCYLSGEIYLVRVAGETAEKYKLEKTTAVNVVGKDITSKLENRGWKLPGTSSLTLADVDGDGSADLIVAWPFAPDLVELDAEKAKIFDATALERVKTELTKTKESIIIFFARQPPNGGSDADSANKASGFVWGVNEKEGFCWFVLQPSENRLDLYKIIFSLYGWEVMTYKQILDYTASDYYLGDLNADGYADLLASTPDREKLCVWWGPDFVWKTVLPIPADPWAFAFGFWSAGALFISGKTSFFLSKDGKVLTSVPLSLPAGDVHYICVQANSDARSPPNFVFGVSDPPEQKAKILIFCGKDFLDAREIWCPWRIWDLPYGADAITAGDYDGDGLTDVVVACKELGHGEVLFGSGERKAINLQKTVFLYTGDLDGDSFDDVLVLGKHGEIFQLRFFYGTSAKELVPSAHFVWLPIAGDQFPRFVSVQDLNGDRKMDISIWLSDRILNYISAVIPERSQIIQGVRFDTRRLELKRG